METTQLVTAKYTELYDMSTEVGENVYYKVHTPTGISHIKKLAGFYKQFKEYKYLGARIALVPITTLPKDLLDVGYEAGDGVDPRDLINPILHKGYKGEHLITDYLSERTLWTENDDATDAGNQGKHLTRQPRMTESGGVSYQKITDSEDYSERNRDVIRAMYYTSLTDPEWQKAHPREGFYHELFPLVRTLASTGPISGTAIKQSRDKAVPTENTENGQTNELIVDRDITKAPTIRVDGKQNTSPNSYVGNVSITNSGILSQNTDVLGYHPVNMVDIFTHEFERLGWMETSGKGANIGQNTVGTINGPTDSLTDLDINRMPKVYMYLIQTPPAYKQKQYYRMSITHHFAFRKFRQVYGIDMPNIWSDQVPPENLRQYVQIDRMYNEEGIKRIAGMKMYDQSGTLHDDDFVIPPYEPALENSIEADGVGTTIEKISDGVA